jgi:hypothetical protein
MKDECLGRGEHGEKREIGKREREYKEKDRARDQFGQKENRKYKEEYCGFQ